MENKNSKNMKIKNYNNSKTKLKIIRDINNKEIVKY